MKRDSLLLTLLVLLVMVGFIACSAMRDPVGMDSGPSDSGSTDSGMPTDAPSSGA